MKAAIMLFYIILVYTRLPKRNDNCNKSTVAVKIVGDKMGAKVCQMIVN